MKDIVKKLQGRVALVVGGGRGIGHGIVTCLAEAGADVAVADIIYENAQKVAEEVKALGVKTIAIQVDVTQENQVQDMVRQTVDRLGRLDIAVNDAGAASSKPVEELTEEDWDFVFNVNAKGVFLCCKAEIPSMKKQNWGRIINVASVAGKEGCPNLAHYCASKFAVVGFTNTLAKELARTGITVNAICPGLVGTDLWLGPTGLAEKWKKPGETMEESWKRNHETLIPQGVPQTPKDMGDLAVYFALADHVTGQAVNVDGGYTFH